MAVGALIALGCGGLALFLAVRLPDAGVSRTAMITLLLSMPVVLACYGVGAWLFSSSFERARSLHVTPPGLYEPEMPTEAHVLVRGAGEPDVAPELLRVAQRPEANTEHQLLRTTSAPGHVALAGIQRRSSSGQGEIGTEGRGEVPSARIGTRAK